MARTVRSTPLETRTARLRLPPRRKPYRTQSAKAGLHLGYRRIAGKNGSWIGFTYQGASGKYAERAFAQADDYSDADDGEVLTYFDAMQRVSGEAPPVRHASACTVEDAIGAYVKWLQQQRKTASDAKQRLAAYVTPFFGERPLSSLKREDFSQWLTWAIDHKPRGRLKDGKQSIAAKRARASARGKKAAARVELPAAERARRRRSTLNRIINSLKACLTRAAGQQTPVISCDAWSQLQKFPKVDSARIARLTTEEATRLTNASGPDFRRLVEVALLTGCRYGELTALRTKDFDAGSRTVLVAESKSGKPRRVPLTDEGVELLDELTAGKAPDDLVLTKADGTAWAKSEQFRRIRAACAAAKIAPAVNFHALRHTFASVLVEAGTPLAFVAEALGHADTRMVSKHYAHLTPSIVHNTIRANLPSFGIQTAGKVRKIRP